MPTQYSELSTQYCFAAFITRNTFFLLFYFQFFKYGTSADASRGPI